MNLKKIRLERGLSVPALAELTGLHRRTIEDIERRSDCMMSTAAKLSAALNVTLDDLWEKAGE